jgi:hypothetical protein
MIVEKHLHDADGSRVVAGRGLCATWRIPVSLVPQESRPIYQDHIVDFGNHYYLISVPAITQQLDCLRQG